MDHPEPTPEELRELRARLAALGAEPAPRDVVVRLERRLDEELPAAVRTREAPVRRRRWLAPALALAAPAAVAAVVAAVVLGGGSEPTRETAGRAVVPAGSTAAEDSALPEGAPAVGASTAPDDAAGGSAAAGDLRALGQRAEKEARDARAAARRAYDRFCPGRRVGCRGLPRP